MSMTDREAQEILERFNDRHPVLYEALSMIVLLLESAVILALLGWGVWALGKVLS